MVSGSRAQPKALPAYFGRYQVLEELGSGAMGDVYLCIDSRLGRPVAIKVLRDIEHSTPAEHQERRARFRQEAEAAGRLNHPDIVRVYDVQVFDTGPSFLAMEFLEGWVLSILLESGMVLPARQAALLTLRVADALDYAHKGGVVHRDIKPANIMLTSDGGMKVMDFGVARLADSNLTAVGVVLGSVRYMAPEQMMGHKVDGRADIFSLAAVAYEVLTGKVAFPGKSITEVAQKVVHGTHVPPRQLDGRLPEGIDRVFARALAPSPEGRYLLAMDFGRDLQSAVEPVLDRDFVDGTPERDLGKITIPWAMMRPLASPHGAPPPPPEETTLVAPRKKAAAPRAATPRAAEATPRRSEEQHPAPPAPVQAPKAATPLPPATRPAEAARSGPETLLLLDSDPPGARVFLDGKPVGQTPLHSLDVGLGRHTVRMELEERSPVSKEVEVERDQPLKVVVFTLPQPDPGGPIRPGQFVEFGPDVTPPRRLSGEPAVYPEEARERGVVGEPVVELCVSGKGDVVDVSVVHSAGALLDSALLQAVVGWRFEPATCGGVPVAVRLTVQHTFQR